MFETPEEAAHRFARPMLAQGFKFEALHLNTDKNGNPLWWRIRLKHPQTGDKWMRPLSKNDQGWQLREPTFHGRKPLYGLHHIVNAPAATVWVVEGEQKADALSGLGLLATTSGSATSANAADWEPLRGRNVRIWPDNDQPGMDYAEEVGANLISIGCAVSCLDVCQFGLEAGEDVVDWLLANPGATASDIEALPQVAVTVGNDRVNLQAKAGTCALVRGDEVEPEPIDWLWNGWLAAGKLHIIGGQPETGKTTIAIAIAATFSSGGLLPDGSRAPLGDTLVWSGEDDFQDTILPRFIANGGARERLHHITGRYDGTGVLQPFDPANDITALVTAAKGLPDLRLIVIDPVVSVVSGDSHKNTEVRRAMQPLVQLAEQAKAAILGITHLSKGTAGRDPIERITGSLAFAALPRLIWGTAKSSEPGQPSRLVRVKSNIGPGGNGFEYDLVQTAINLATGLMGQKVEWGAALEGSAKALIAELDGPEDPGRVSALGAAKAWLVEMLGTGTVRVTFIEEMAKEKGHAWPTVKRAKTALGVESIKQGSECWAWQMPKVIKA